ncbi:MAG: phosphoribosylanthranilate isomerase [Janthinobacterium lividum]
MHNPPARTRIKLCGMTRREDIDAAIDCGADALGLVFYQGSARHVSVARAAELLRGLPPFVAAVGLFVNASVDEVRAAVSAAPLSMLQFHGDETLEQCAVLAEAVGLPFLRAIRVTPAMRGADLLEYDLLSRQRSALFSSLLLDTWVDGYGGSGKVFDWSIVPEQLAPRVVLSGGLSAQNATEAVVQVRPCAVDVSSGIEAAKGIKDDARMRAFVAAVRLADVTRTHSQ